MESNQKKLFIVGSPRSGTTWVQLLLSQHEAVATAPETQIFAYYLVHFQRQWRHEHEGPGSQEQGGAGLSRLLSEAEFEDLCRRSAGAVLEKIASRNPGAAVVAEKSPQHALMADFIHRIFPDAYFLHVLRDPRDTAASLLAAGRSWGRGWAPKNAIDAARMWDAHVRSARRVAHLPGHYLEIRYEDLRAGPVAGLRRLFEWLDIPASVSRCEEMVEACDLKNLRQNANGKMPIPGAKSPKGFFRKGAVGGWQKDLSSADVRIIEHLCAEVMDESGYERVASGRTRPPLRIPVHDAIQRVRESIDWQLEKLLYRV